MRRVTGGDAQAMVKTVLYAEKLYDNDKVEREVFGSDVRVVWRNVANLSQLEERDCAEIDGLMVMRHAVTAEYLARFPKLACVVRMGVGYERVRSLEALMEQTDTLSIHALLTPETRGMISRAMLERMPKGGVVVNTARGPIVDVDALADLLKRGHLAGVGLDVLPVEPPVEPIPELLRAYRAREPWCEGRLIITPHSAFFTPEAWDDTRLKAAETMRAALVGPRPQNVITPEMF